MSDKERSLGKLWESHSWGFSNSDNSGGSEKKLGQKKPPRPVSSSNNSPTAIATALGQKRGVLNDGNPSPGGGVLNVGNPCPGGGESDLEMHIWTERERRKKMRTMFSSLHDLLPQLPPKADKSTIVDEAIKYIKTLQHNLQSLQKQRLDKLQSATMVNLEPLTTTSQARPYDNNLSLALNMPQCSHPLPVSQASFQTWFSPNVVINVCGDDAQISVCAPLRKQGLSSAIFYILEKHNLKVVSAHISSDHFRSMYMIHAHADGARNRFSEALSVEETFKLAVGEIIFWLVSC